MHAAASADTLYRGRLRRRSKRGPGGQRRERGGGAAGDRVGLLLRWRACDSPTRYKPMGNMRHTIIVVGTRSFLSVDSHVCFYSNISDTSATRVLAVASSSDSFTSA